MYGLFILLGSAAITVGFWWFVINLFRKRPKKKPGMIFAVGFGFLLLGAILAPAVEESETETASEETVAPEPTEEEKKADEEAKKKEEADKAAKEKETAETAKAAEKEFYVNEMQSKVDTQMGMFDEAWSTFWVPTFEGISNGTVDQFEAYQNMKSLEQRYETLRASFPGIESDGLSEENQKLFEEFVEKMRSASWWRMEGAKKAQDMFDEGNFKPSEMDAITSDINFGDGEMMDALVSLTSLQMDLGIELE